MTQVVLYMGWTREERSKRAKKELQLWVFCWKSSSKTTQVFTSQKYCILLLLVNRKRIVLYNLFKILDICFQYLSIKNTGQQIDRMWLTKQDSVRTKCMQELWDQSSGMGGFKKNSVLFHIPELRFGNFFFSPYSTSVQYSTSSQHA